MSTRWPATRNRLATPRWRPVGGYRPAPRCTPRGVPRPSGRPILVVEDEPAIRALLVEFLRGEGYTVEAARDGHEALRLLDEHGPNGGPSVVLLDMMLPRMDGAELMRQLRARGLAVPVVAMSASHEALTTALAAGARAAVAKPFDLDGLLWTLRRQIAATA
jgi:CheY-like chemotaxis protein